MTLMTWTFSVPLGITHEEVVEWIEKHYSKELEKKKNETDKIFFLNNKVEEAIRSIQLEKSALNILKNEDPALYLMKAIRDIHVGEESTVAWHIFSGLSGGLKDRRSTIHLALTGNSGKGKSSIQEHVGLIFENIETVTSSSAKSQFYKADAGQLPDSGIMRFDEAEGSEEALILERALTDRGLTIPTHDTITVNRKYKQIRISQINAVWRNSVNPPADEQVSNRYVFLNVNESSKQDRLVAEKQVKEYCYDLQYNKETPCIELARAIVTKIKEKPIKIIIPYGYLIESSDYGNRRSLPKFLALIKTITYLYRFQRRIINDYCFATRKDVEIAQLLWEQAAQSEKTHTNKAQEQLLSILPDDETNAMDRKQLSNLIGKGISSILNYLRPLILNGIVSYKEVFDGTKKKFYWKIKDCQRVSFSIDWNKIKVEDLWNKIKETVINLDGVDEYNFYDAIMDDTIPEELMTLLKNPEKLGEESLKMKTIEIDRL